MSDAAVKESRRVLRLISDHIEHAHLNLGAQREPFGLVDVIHHPQNRVPYLNYVSPRKKTAWIPGPEIEKGLAYLKELGRTPRVYYVEGLFPPLFARSLRDLGLTMEREIELMVYKVRKPGHGGSGVPHMPDLPSEIKAEFPDDQNGVALWWYVWRNAHYDVLTHGMEPLYIGRDIRAVVLGQQIDVLLYRYSFPVGVARITLHDETAHINALALMKEARTPENVRLLHEVALYKAYERGAELIFTTGKAATDRQLCREIGFVDSGSIVCYSEASKGLGEEIEEDDVAEPVFVLQ